jgi:ABC-type microcin C transport system permease subunit YejE
MSRNAQDTQTQQASNDAPMRPLTETELGAVSGGRDRVVIIIITSKGEVIVIEP